MFRSLERQSVKKKKIMKSDLIEIKHTDQRMRLQLNEKKS